MTARWTDPITRHAVRLIGLETATLQALTADINRALETVAIELDKGPVGRPFTYARFMALRGELEALRRALAGALGTTVADAVNATADTSMEAVRTALEALEGIAVDAGFTTFTVSFTALDARAIAAIAGLPHDGMSWTRWGSRLADDTMARVTSELRQGASLGETVQQLRRRLEKAADLSKVSAERLARTALTSTATRTRLETYRANSDVIAKVRFQATLDSRTSLTCAALSGREWPVGSPDIAAPPRHPSCRSQLLPVTKSWEELLGSEGRELDAEMPDGTQSSMNGQVPGDWTYSDWLSRQPTEFQREVLGDVRYRAFRNGVPLEGMATYDRPLTTSELRALYSGKIPA